MRWLVTKTHLESKALAVVDDYLPTNPVDGTSTPWLSEHEMQFLDAEESLADVGGHLHVGPMKSHRSRIVPIPGFLPDLVAERLDHHVEALIRRLDDIRARNLAAQTRPRDQLRGIERGGR